MRSAALGTALSTWLISGVAFAHPGHGVPHSYFHLEGLLGVALVAAIAAGIYGWRMRQSRRAVRNKSNNG